MAEDYTPDQVVDSFEVFLEAVKRTAAALAMPNEEAARIVLGWLRAVSGGWQDGDEHHELS